MLAPYLSSIDCNAMHHINGTSFSEAENELRYIRLSKPLYKAARMRISILESGILRGTLIGALIESALAIYIDSGNFTQIEKDG